MSNKKNALNIENDVKQWLEQVVVGLQLCPFAKAPLQKKQIRFAVSTAESEEQLNQELINECQHLDANTDIETSLLICPTLLSDFFDFCQFLNWAEATLKQNQWQGIYQLAHFHPHYCFAGVDYEAPQNLSNRAPYPILHILREASLENILERFEKPETIPEKNIATMNQLSEEEKRRYFHYLYR